jgi:hypothetical protein
VSTPGAPIQYGQVWISREEVMGLVNYLIVSSDAALQEQVAELHPNRHAAVAAQIRELIGN